ncbi:putative piggyBac transposable element-derived protein 4-like [Triplophysa rosa]|uniref:PiggyBac transposable element-derived protein 4-like n=1 Tax=Triplophysa rosa TaxID=992332 RepID=A0A9W7WN74_TRIRA|nr:putative piggyBac transposable element-derived protein 4-like [Triplophysa rosa]
MKKYIGMLLYMGVMDLPKIRDFWRVKTLFHVPFPATVMTRDRFLTISCNLYISDPLEDAVNDQKRGTEAYDRLHRVKPLLDLIRNRCMSIYHPKQHISVDERMIPTKARLSFKQYMKAKPTKWGIKLFVMADTTLCSGYVIYCDNFYTSPLLFRHLHRLGFGACGTCREGRAGVSSTKQNSLNNRSPRGSIHWIRDDELLFIKWMDTSEVSMCTLRWQNTQDGRKQRVPVPRPVAVQQYNKYMGGWYMTIFQHFLDIAVTNSFNLHKELCAIHQDKPMARRYFLRKWDHLLVSVGNIQRANMGWWRCVQCKRSTLWKCQECDVGLCLQLYRNCFKQHHL